MSKDYYVLIKKSVNDVKVIGIYNYSDAFSTKNKLLVDNPTVIYDIQGPFSLGCNKMRPILPKFNNKYFLLNQIRELLLVVLPKDLKL